MDSRVFASKVSRVRGKTVEEVSLATTSFFNVEFVPNETNTAFLGITTTPHSFEETDIVSVSGLSTDFAWILQLIQSWY